MGVSFQLLEFMYNFVQNPSPHILIKLAKYVKQSQVFIGDLQSLLTVLLHLLHPDQAEGVAGPGAGHGSHLRPLQRARLKLEDGVLVP